MSVKEDSSMLFVGLQNTVRIPIEDVMEERLHQQVRTINYFEKRDM